MIENIQITISNVPREVPKGITLEEIAKQEQEFFQYPIILAKVDGQIKELTSKVIESENIEFLDLTSREGNRAHVSGLTFLLIVAVKELYGNDKNIIVQHSLDKGIYIETNFIINSDSIANIKQRVQQLVENDLDKQEGF